MRTVAAAKPRPTLIPTSAGPRGTVTFDASDAGTVGDTPEEACPPDPATLPFVNAQVCSDDLF
jgi:hypothetical protein